MTETPGVTREREEFAKWWLDPYEASLVWEEDGKPADSDLWDIWEAWQAAYAAGQRDAREEAAKIADYRAPWVAEAIRALSGTEWEV